VRGDLDALEQVLDPAVTLRAVEPGPWDCEDRDQVMSLLRLVRTRRRKTSRDADVRRVNESTFLVSRSGGPDGVATLVKIARGKVISMQQISTDATDPLADAAVAAVRSGDAARLPRS